MEGYGANYTSMRVMTVLFFLLFTQVIQAQRLSVADLLSLYSKGTLKDADDFLERNGYTFKSASSINGNKEVHYKQKTSSLDEYYTIDIMLKNNDSVFAIEYVSDEQAKNKDDYERYTDELLQYGFIHSSTKVKPPDIMEYHYIYNHTLIMLDKKPGETTYTEGVPIKIGSQTTLFLLNL